jgi:hypothetical protein
MVDLLRHPLVILLFGALISGLLVPSITRGWQNHQKALEIKTQLVGELSKSIMEFIMAIQFARLGAESQRQADFDKAYLGWEVQSAVIGTKLQAYFPDTTIPEEWSAFSELVTEFYALEGIAPDQRQGFMASIKGKLGASFDAGDRAQVDWGELKKGILRRESELIQKVLATKITVLR